MKGSKVFIEISSSERDNSKSDRKGRSRELLNNRNEKLFHRFYYYSKILQYSYVQVLNALVIEFDISESTLVQLIAKSATELTVIRDKKLTRQQLKRRYPYYNWNDKAVVIVAQKRQIFELS